MVLYNAQALTSLPARELANGMAEVIKAGAILDASLFDAAQRDATPVLARDAQALTALIAAAVRVKADVVSADDKESGLRAVLNFGHTVGHALETLLQVA